MKKSIYNFAAETISGKKISLKDYKGKVVLIVNTASKCGFTPQYGGLEKLYKKYQRRGFVILGFPCNQFGNQEPGTSQEIKSVCFLNYGVTFQMFSKVEVNGKNAHPLFLYLQKSLSGFLTNKIKWNFTKFLIDREGNPVKRFGSNIKPKQLERDIEKLL